jgi:GGDEF domain-containing protein
LANHLLYVVSMRLEMQQPPPDLSVGGPPKTVAGRVLHPRRWLLGRRFGEDGSAFAFGMRLLATVALTFTLIGITGYVLLERSLAHRQISDYAAAQRADGRAFEDDSARAVGTADAIGDIDRFLDGVARRPGTREAFLIDQKHVIRAAANGALVGTTDSDTRIDTALEDGTSYAGNESDPIRDGRDFEFIVPVELRGQRYAYEVTYDHRTYNAQLNEVRRILILVGLLTFFGGGGVFYLFGGRKLMRDHRMVLHRATRDGLTDLPNMRAFQDEFPQAAASAARYEDPFALALLDVDDFKLINDRQGHPWGDAILKRVAGVLREARPGDRAYRIGGDEFVLLLDTPTQRAPES